MNANYAKNTWYPLGVIDQSNVVLYKVKNSSSDVIAVGKSFDNPERGVEALHRAFFEEEAWHRMLEHRNVISFIGSCSDRKFIIMEFAEHGDLLTRMGNVAKPLWESKLRRYFNHLVDGLSYMHQKGISHGDLKPDNILVCADDTAKICDFGHSRYFVDGVHVTYEKRYGTKRYMAPEVYHRASHCPAQADIWSIGASLLAVLVSYQWKKPDSSDFHFAHFFEKVRNVKPWSEIPEAAGILLEGILKINPEERLSLEQIGQSLWLSQS